MLSPVKVPGTLDSLQIIAQYVLKAAALAGLDKRASYRLRQAVDEIATNAITHGYAEANLDGDLIVSGEIDDRTLTISIEDTGVAYDPREAPTPDVTLPPEERPTGGLGVYLALRNVDRFTYERVDGRNRTSLVMELPPFPRPRTG